MFSNAQVSPFGVPLSHFHGTTDSKKAARKLSVALLTRRLCLGDLQKLAHKSGTQFTGAN